MFWFLWPRTGPAGCSKCPGCGVAAMDGDGPAMPRPRHATRWSSTLRQPCVPVWLPRWSPVEMVSGCTGRRRFLSTGTGKGLQAPLRWKPSQPSFPHASVTPRALGGEALQCPTPFLGWKSHPIPSHQFKHKRKLQHQTTALCGTQLPRPCPQTLIWVGQAMPSSTARDQASKDTTVWATLSTRFAGFAVCFKTQLLQSGG